MFGLYMSDHIYLDIVQTYVGHVSLFGFSDFKASYAECGASQARTTFGVNFVARHCILSLRNPGPTTSITKSTSVSTNYYWVLVCKSIIVGTGVSCDFRFYGLVEGELNVKFIHKNYIKDRRYVI